ncbi:MAG: zinc ribbon domain-containing protein [Thermoplasmata archaeon]|nr:zinc ribbon domain-containing protein [Thermoplasmata archaeon]
MANCSKCGAEVVGGADYCSSCGSAVRTPVIEPEKKVDERRPGRVLAGIGAILIGIAIILAIVFFGPVRSVDDVESRNVPYRADVDKIDLHFWTDIADVNIAFEDLTNELFILDVTMHGGVGLFDSPDEYDLTFHDPIAGDTLNLNIELDTPEDWNMFLNVDCDLRIHQSLAADIEVASNTGKITLNTVAGVELDSLALGTYTGRIKANLVEDVSISGDMALQTDTGSISLSWRNLDVVEDVFLTIGGETGGVDVTITQEVGIPEDITVNVRTTTGGIDFEIDIQGDIGARITSSTDTGGIDVIKQDGFTRIDSLLESENYPEDDNFIVSLSTDTGGIDLDADYTA